MGKKYHASRAGRANRNPMTPVSVTANGPKTALGGCAKAAWLTHVIPGHDEMDYDNNRASLQCTARVMQIRNRPCKPRCGLAPRLASLLRVSLLLLSS